MTDGSSSNLYYAAIVSIFCFLLSCSASIGLWSYYGYLRYENNPPINTEGVYGTDVKTITIPGTVLAALACVLLISIATLLLIA